MHSHLTETVWEIIRLFFPPDQQAEAAAILAQRLEQPRDYWSGDAERCCLAALKLSEGDLGTLRAWVQDDYRDMLLNADFGYDVTAHHSWANRVKAEGPAAE
jgi:hypothetical protein